MPLVSTGDPYASVTNVPCPVAGCEQTVVWYEAGYVPGYRVCVRLIDDEKFDQASLRHRFQARDVGSTPKLVRHDCCELHVKS